MELSPAHILVFCENPELLRELVGKARLIADAQEWKVALLLTWETELDLDRFPGADLVYQPTLPVSILEPESITNLLDLTIRQVKPRLILMGATRSGLESAPRIAERFNAGYAAWVNDFALSQNGQTISASTMLYSGLGFAEYEFHEAVVILSIAAGVYPAIPLKQGPVDLITLDYIQSPGIVHITGYKEKSVSDSGIARAHTIVDIGQGVKRQGDLAIISNLAKALGGQVGCTRPIASDRNWFSEWLGLSGMMVSPELCFTIGISGAIQHMIGIRGSKRIVAINNDESAAIFTQCDYGVVADLYTFVPILLERIKARGICKAEEIANGNPSAS